MIIDCEAAIVLSNCADRVRYSRAKVGLAADHSTQPVLIVITAQSKDKFKVVDNCTLRKSTISFESPKKHLYLRNCDQLMLKAFMALITKIQTKQLYPKLANITTVEKLKPKPTALYIKDNNFNSTDLSNKCLQKLFCENFRLIPRLVWKLNNLFELKIINCDLTEIPLKLHDLALSLRVLDLSQNSIKSIDGSFVLAMYRLKALDLSHNKLAFIPLEIKRMQSLERLNLSHNQLNRLPNTLGTICSLKCLDLSHNNFECLSYFLIKLFLGFVRLNNLDVSNNPMSKPVLKATKINRPFHTLQSLSLAKLLSTDSLLYSCHKLLPQTLYNYIQINGENCYICNEYVVNEEMKHAVTLILIDKVADQISKSHFPSNPYFPCLQYICYLCYNNKITDILRCQTCLLVPNCHS